MTDNGDEPSDTAMGRALLLEDLDLDLDPHFLCNPNLFSTLPHVVDVLERQNNNKGNNGSLSSSPQDHISDHPELDPAAISSSTAMASLERNLQVVTSLLEAKVNSHYRAFGSSVNSFGHIFQDFTEVQSRVTRLKTHVASTKHALRTRKYGLRDLREQRSHQTQVLELLDQVRQVADAPVRFRALLMSGLVVECVDEWKAAHHLAFSDALRDLPALEDVRHDLMAHKQAIYDSLLRHLSRALSSSCSALESFGNEDGNTTQLHKTASRSQPPDTASLVAALLGLDRLTSAVQNIRRGMRTDIQRLFAYHLRLGMSSSTCTSRSNKNIPHNKKNNKDYSIPSILTLYKRGFSVRQALVPILADAIQMLRNHAVFVSQPGVSGTGYTTDELWSAIQVQTIEFLDLHVQPPTTTQAGRRGASREGGPAPHGRHGRRRSSGATVIGEDGTRQLCFLELSLDDLDPSSNTIALGGAGEAEVHASTNHGTVLRRQRSVGAGGGWNVNNSNSLYSVNDEDDEEDDEFILSVPLCVPHPQMLVALCEPVAQFADQALKIVQVSSSAVLSHTKRNNSNSSPKPCRLLEHLRETGVDLLKPVISASIQDRLDAVLTSSGICEPHTDTNDTHRRGTTLADTLLLGDSPTDPSSSSLEYPWMRTNGESNGLTDALVCYSKSNGSIQGGTETGVLDLYGSSVHSRAAAETLAVVRDLRAIVYTVPDHICHLEDLIPLALRQFVNVHRHEHDKVLAGSRVLALVSNGRWGLARLSVDHDPVLQRLCGLSSVGVVSDPKVDSDQPITDEDMREIQRHSFVARQHALVYEFMGSKDYARLSGPLSRNAQVTLAATAASVGWVANYLVSRNGNNKSSNNSASESPAMQAVVHDLRTLRRDCLVALHVNALLLVHEELGMDSLQQQPRDESSLAQRLASHLASLSTRISTMSSAVSTFTGFNKRQTSYMIHSAHFAAAHIVATHAASMANGQGASEVTAFKAVLRNTLVLQAVLHDHSDGWLRQSQRRVFSVLQRYLAALLVDFSSSSSANDMQALVVELGECVPGLDIGPLKMAVKRRRSSASVASLRNMAALETSG